MANPANDLWRRAKESGAPLIEGGNVKFVWFGDSAPRLVGDFNDWGRREPLELQPVAPQIWVRELAFPEDAYIEYAFIDQDGARVPDPFNPRRVPNGVGQTNHFFYMPRGGPSALARRKRGVPRGKVTRHIIEPENLIADRRRSVYLYQPPGPGPYPLLVVWDGYDYLRRARLDAILDNLIAQERICPLALAMPQNGGPARHVEYACSDSTLELLQANILPLAQAHLDLVDLQTSPGAYGVLGASMGGLMALYAALRLPHIFGHALSQSGAFWLDVTETVVFDLVEFGPPKTVKIWLEAGSYDIKRLLPANRAMRALLERRGYQLAYHEYPAGHNYSAWRDELWRGLEYLFPTESSKSDCQSDQPGSP